MLKIKRNHIIDHLQQNRKSVVKIAREIGISYMHLYRIIRRRSTPSLPLAKAIAMSLGVGIDDLFEFEKEHA